VRVIRRWGRGHKNREEEKDEPGENFLINKKQIWNKGKKRKVTKNDDQKTRKLLFNSNRGGFWKWGGNFEKQEEKGDNRLSSILRGEKTLKVHRHRNAKVKKKKHKQDCPFGTSFI